MTQKFVVLVIHETVQAELEDLRLVERYNAGVIALAYGRRTQKEIIYNGLFGFVYGSNEQQFFSIRSLVEAVAKEHPELLQSLENSPKKPTIIGLSSAPVGGNRGPNA